MPLPPDTLPLSQLTAFIRRVFGLNLPQAVWVSAELGQAGESRGHYWLTLVEKGAADEGIVAQLEAVLWAGHYKKLARTHGTKLLLGLLTQGMSVRLRVTTSFHERYGLRLIVEDIDPDHTIGSLERRRQATLTALAADGLLDRNAALPLPALPQRLAVISSDTAAGREDFERQLAPNEQGYHFRSELFPAAMQGVQTTEEICARLRQIQRRRAEFDLVVVVRGGGGRTDLAAFDDEDLCRAVAAAPLPVITGIGHETDTTVLDRVVHRSLKTPTAAAVFLLDCLGRAEANLLNTARRIHYTTARLFQEEDGRLKRAQTALYPSTLTALRAEHQRTAALKRELHLTTAAALRSAHTKLDAHRLLLDALRPETTLARGYALVSQDGKLVVEPEAVHPGEVEVKLASGRLRLQKPG